MMEARKRRVARSEKDALTNASKRQQLLTSLVGVHAASVTNELLKGAVARSVELRERQDALPTELRPLVEGVKTAAARLLGSGSRDTLEAGVW